LLTVSAICAETSEKADEVALSSLVWALQRGKGEGKGVPSIVEARHYTLNEKEKETMEKMKRNMVIGNPQQVKQKLNELQTKFKADEIMLVTITHSPEDRIQSYKLIAKEVI
jgi:alkanesulfonate monooxygenase SsuD/methylene tetrahydromethanopterin reductase-like flavin-dependent oxidoreductase (luciferase family)